MKTGRIAAAIGVVVGGVLAAQPLLAQTVPFPTAARFYVTWMARAMDQCTPSGMSVTSPGLPSAGCLQANSATDSTINMSWARLTLAARTGKILLVGRGFQFGSRVRAQLTLRVTRKPQSTKHPQGSNSVTFEDVNVLCPVQPFWVVARRNGALIGSARLSDCLTQSGYQPGLANGNIEILDAALLNVDSNKIFAKPGYVR